ncbi:hypothetical protein AA15237_2370 [Komagataeibacter xylinus NBRC 15237]|nr:hypothetical protein AA15237_2370 [Komagataeibacter xylinus NBRC 15237]
MAGSAVVSAVPSICSIIIRLDTISTMSLLRRGEREGMGVAGADCSVRAVVKGGIVMHDSRGTELQAPSWRYGSTLQNSDITECE